MSADLDPRLGTGPTGGASGGARYGEEERSGGEGRFGRLSTEAIVGRAVTMDETEELIRGERVSGGSGGSGNDVSGGGGGGSGGSGSGNEAKTEGKSLEAQGAGAQSSRQGAGDPKAEKKAGGGCCSVQ
mmetsp:Transcript_3674/g.8642  ORF Transcript_3674/g.8642 Transcript_3674/m.8642 type:complete len:129 (+) Transcript_3674:113-499(+)